MPRKPIIRTNEFEYHVTARCNNREWYKIPLKEVWEIYQEVFNETTEKFGIEVGAFILMNNHFHAILRTPLSNIDQAMWNIMRQSSLKIAAKSQRINKIYGSRYHATLIASDALRPKVYRYLFRNPVKAKICPNVEQYPYSTLSKKHGFLLVQDAFLEDICADFDFLNQPELEKVDEQIRKGLKRKMFDGKKIRRKVLQLEPF